MSDSASTFAGLRVIDFTNNLAGPLATMILADLGADVIKVERPDVGDDTRALPEQWGDESAIFASANRNKRSIVLDLKDPADQEIALRLVDTADVVVESFRPGKMDAVGLSAQTLLARRPSLIYCSVSAFGRTESGRALPGYDPIVQAFTGIMAATGHEGTPPARAGASVIDNSSGMWAAMAIMAALIRRQRTGIGEHIETTLLDAGLSMMAKEVAILQGTGASPRRLGSASSFGAPYEAFQTADGWIMVAAANTSLFQRLCIAISLPEVAAAPRFATPADRTARRAELHELLEAVFRGASSASWIRSLSAAGVPAGPINDLAAAMRSPIVAERGLMVRTVGAAGNGRRLLRTPLETGADPCYRWAPRLGEHNDEIRRELAETMPPTVEDVIRASEQRRYASMLSNNVADLSDMLSERLRYQHLNGSVDSKESYLRQLRLGHYRYRSITAATDRVQVIGTTALAYGSMHAIAEHEGEPVHLRCRTLSVWVFEDRWRLVAYQPTGLSNKSRCPTG